MAGLQTIILNNLVYDGSCDTVEVRLVREDDRDAVVAVLGQLEQRAYDNEGLVFAVPSDLEPGAADSILLYCVESQTSLGWGRFG
jgi:hypothetical protein